MKASDPLSIALAASKPIDDAPRQPLAVELLLSESQQVDEIDLLVSELRNLKPENP